MIKITVTETDYFLPEDGKVAEQKFLELLRKFSEVWICAFGFTLQPMFDELKKADAAGAKLHILLDHSQERGKAEAPRVQDLAAHLKHGDLTITTAGVNSEEKDQIWHWKGMVVKPTDGQEYHCWEGSTNFSQSAWFQGNSARVFRSDPWGQAFIKQFEAHRAWALANEPQYQVITKRS
jgi:hypothetical protein